MINTSALPYIPQRDPFVLVNNILHCDHEVVSTNFTIPKSHTLVHNNHLTEAGLMENIAQTCAARIGWLNKDKPVRIGVIGSINNFEILKLPQSGDTIVTTVTVVSEVFDAIIVHAITQRNNIILAHCDMKVFVI